jgi:DNA processing protein
MKHAKNGEQRRSEAALGLACVCNAGSNAALRLLKSQPAEAIMDAGEDRLVAMGMQKIPAERFVRWRKTNWSDEMREQALEAMRQADLRFVPYGGPGYAPQFMDLSHPPAGLFVKGADERLEHLLGSPRVTIVGTRRATAYGTRAARDLAAAFTARGIAVVSGMALGIDGRTHEAALDGGGLTAAILGCGADVVYPPRHRSLYDRIVESGLVMSELPTTTPPSRYTFPNRNRLLAALGDAVVVVEGSLTSGAMQTAEQAAQLGRPVFALPGSIYLEGHRGCNLLIRDGATPTIDPEATVEEFLLQTRIERGERRPPEPLRQSRGRQDPFRELAAAGREEILEAMDDRPCSIDALIVRTGMSARRLTAALAELELAGLTTRAGPGLYIRAP